MQKLLEEIWNSYRTEHPNETKEILDTGSRIVAFEEKLFKTMTPEQVEIFCECEEEFNKKNALSQKDAFAAGVRFALNFLFEVFCTESE